MADLSKQNQRPDGSRTGRGESADHDTGAEFGTSERATRGTDRDADETGVSKNQGHGHPREERGQH